MGSRARYVSIIVIDVEKFGSRPDYLKSVLRRDFHQLLRTALEEVGVDLSRDVVGWVDRGDGVAVLVDPSISKETLTGAFVDGLAEELRRHAVRSAEPAVMRWRMSLHAGEVTPDPDGFSGGALNTACRIVDEQLLRDVLTAAGTAQLVVALSEEWHRSVVGAGWASGAAYREAPIAVKELRDRIHVRVPGFRTPPWPAGKPGKRRDSGPGVGPPEAPEPPGPAGPAAGGPSGDQLRAAPVRPAGATGAASVTVGSVAGDVVNGPKTSHVTVHGDVDGGIRG